MKVLYTKLMALRSSNHAGRRTAITDIHTEIIETHILTKLDGPTLASAACASPLLNAMCVNEKVWTDICNSTWASTKHPRVQRTISTFPGGHRSFFSDSFPILHHGRRCGHCQTQLQTSELISAVDIHYKNKLVYSKVSFTNTNTTDFFDSTFRVELLDQKESVRMPVKYEDDEDVYLSDLKESMTLSWIVIDPTQKRAANMSSRRPVTVRPHWIGGDIEVKYATTVDGDYRDEMTSKFMEFRIVVKLGWEGGGELHLRKVKLQVLDMEGNRLSGKESLGILQEAVRSGKRKQGKRGEETERYRKYVDMKRQRREGRQRRGGHTIISAATTIFLALVFLALIFWRL